MVKRNFIKKWDKNQEKRGGVRDIKQTNKRGVGGGGWDTIINTSSYTGYSLNYYKIQDYQCTAFNNNVQGRLFVVVVILWSQRSTPQVGRRLGGGRSEGRSAFHNRSKIFDAPLKTSFVFLLVPVMAAGYQCQTDTRDIRREGGVKKVHLKKMNNKMEGRRDIKSTGWGGVCFWRRM